MKDKGFVYLVKPFEHNVYKIGESINVAYRIAKKEKEKSYRLKCIYSIEVDRVHMWSIENRLHNMFHEYRLAGEWFVLPKEVVKQFPLIVRDVEKTFIGARAYLKG
jgi:hypothetical protein